MLGGIKEDYIGVVGPRSNTFLETLVSLACVHTTELVLMCVCFTCMAVRRDISFCVMVPAGIRQDCYRVHG